MTWPAPPPVFSPWNKRCPDDLQILSSPWLISLKDFLFGTKTSLRSICWTAVHLEHLYWGHLFHRRNSDNNSYILHLYLWNWHCFVTRYSCTFDTCWPKTNLSFLGQLCPEMWRIISCFLVPTSFAFFWFRRWNFDEKQNKVVTITSLLWKADQLMFSCWWRFSAQKTAIH